ncbi:MAG: tyrosine-type recombinase/integrase [archaeon]|nr:tyrosine-type recombinase/integrase [archaeon]
MSNCKETILMKMKARLIDADYTPEQIRSITDMLIFEMADFDVVAQTREIVPYDSETDNLIKLYQAVLLTQGLVPGTVANYTFALNNFRASLNKSLTEATPLDIRMWLAQDQTRVSLRTSDGHRTALLCFYNWLVSEKIITSNPMTPIKPIKYPEEIKLPFSDIEVELLRNNCKSLREKAEIELLLSTGLRVSEMCNLDKKDIDFHSNKIHVHLGKGRKDRIIYMSNVAAMHLKNYLDSRKDTAECLFYTKFRTRLTDKACQDDLKKIGKRAGVSDAHPHRCRHTFATVSYEKGMDIRTIQVLMGHANINQTMKYITTSMTHVENECKRFL